MSTKGQNNGSPDNTIGMPGVNVFALSGSSSNGTHKMGGGDVVDNSAGKNLLNDTMNPKLLSSTNGRDLGVRFIPHREGVWF